MSESSGNDYVVISGSDYLSIAQHYSSAREKMLESAASLSVAAGAVLSCGKVQPMVDLMGTMWTFYKNEQNYMEDLDIFLPAVSALNANVFRQSDAASISDWIGTNVPGGHVPYHWSLMCAACGYTLNGDVIEPSTSS